MWEQEGKNVDPNLIHHSISRKLTTQLYINNRPSFHKTHLIIFRYILKRDSVKKILIQWLHVSLTRKHDSLQKN